jgi:hypothetical protein
MKSVELLGWAMLAAGLSGAYARAEDFKTRQVIGGDLVYTAQVSGRTEAEALVLAENRAAHYLSVECSVPPKEARVYLQKISRTEQRFEASVQIGVSLEDCEAARKAPAERKLSLANPALMEPAKPGAARPPAAPIAYRFTQAQLASHERAIDQRVSAREAERRKLLASFRD